MNIVADQNISGLDETFGQHGSIRRFDGRAIDHTMLGDCDALVIRSVTRVDRSLLSDTSVSFVGMVIESDMSHPRIEPGLRQID